MTFEQFASKQWDIMNKHISEKREEDDGTDNATAELVFQVQQEALTILLNVLNDYHKSFVAIEESMN